MYQKETWIFNMKRNYMIEVLAHLIASTNLDTVAPGLSKVWPTCDCTYVTCKVNVSQKSWKYLKVIADKQSILLLQKIANRYRGCISFCKTDFCLMGIAYINRWPKTGMSTNRAIPKHFHYFEPEVGHNLKRTKYSLRYAVAKKKNIGTKNALHSICDE